jgi:TonB family protein
VNSTFVRATFAAILLASLPAIAEQAQSAPTPVAPKKTELMDAFMAMTQDIQLATEGSGNLVSRLDRLSSFNHTPEVAQKLVKIFGSERPWSLVRAPAANGQAGFQGRLAPWRYTAPDGFVAEWSELALRLQLDKTGRTLGMRGSWPSFVIDDKDMRMEVRGMRLSGTQKRGSADLWFGSAQGNIASMTVSTKAQGKGMRMDDIGITTKMLERPKALEVLYGVTIKAISLEGERIDNFKFTARLTNIDKDAMAALKAAGERNKINAMAPDLQTKAMLPLMKDFAKASLRRGAAFEIDEFSARYQGHLATMKGRVSVPGVTDADFDALPGLVKKIVARFEVRVPLALVRSAASTIARKQLAAQGKTPSEQELAQMSQTMVDVVLGKLLGNGYARIENAVLRSTIEFSRGVLRINGKEVALPTAPAAPAAPSVAAAAPFLDPRMVAHSCTLPAYPADVVRQDLPLQLTLRFKVGANGRVQELVLARPSQFPDYDQALLAAFAGCTYVPGLSGDTPVDVPSSWEIKRSPGDLHPGPLG